VEYWTYESRDTSQMKFEIDDKVIQQVHDRNMELKLIVRKTNIDVSIVSKANNAGILIPYDCAVGEKNDELDISEDIEVLIEGYF
jgi:hypothetical protein